MKEFKLSQNWIKLSDILADDYDSSKTYRIHNNGAQIRVTEELNNPENFDGALYDSNVDIYVNKDVCLKVAYAFYRITIVISEVA